jgi:hypothetical protein
MVSVSEPFAVVAKVELGRVGVENEERLFLVRPGVGIDDRRIESRTRLGTTAGIADAAGVVADDEHRHMARVLELPQLVEDDGVSQVKVRAPLDQRPA